MPHQLGYSFSLLHGAKQSKAEYRRRHNAVYIADDSGSNIAYYCGVGRGYLWSKSADCMTRGISGSAP